MSLRGLSDGRWHRGGTGATGGGIGSTGDGTAGVGGGNQIGRVDQELVSGTRLKAVVAVGVDGSRAPLSDLPTLFWDEKLEQYCAFYNYAFVYPQISAQFSQIFSIGVCIPWPAHFSQSSLYADGECLTPLASQFYTLATRLPRQPKFTFTQGPQTDGGSGLYPSYAGYRGRTYRTLDDGGCYAYGVTDGGEYVVATGTELPLSELVHSKIVIE